MSKTPEIPSAQANPEVKIIPVTQTEWDFRALFPLGDNDPRIEEEMRAIDQNTDKFVNKWKNNKDGSPRKDYLQSPTSLKEALDDFSHFHATHSTGGIAGYYFFLRGFRDQADPLLKAKIAKISEHELEISKKILFFSHNIAGIPPELQQAMLSDPGLQEYRHFLERKWQTQKYLLSEKEENILSLASSPAYKKWIDMSSDILSKKERRATVEDGTKKKMNYIELIPLLSSQDKAIRDEAAAAFNSILAEHSDIAEAELNAVLEYKKIEDRLHGYPRPDSKRHIEDDIETKVVDTMINAVASNFDISRRYHKLKTQLLGLSRLSSHERNVEYKTDKETAIKKYPFPESVRLVHSVINNLDPEFGQIMQSFLMQGRYDAFPKKDKFRNAFCEGNQHLFTPTYINLHHQDILDDVILFAHETGHGINNELSRENQNELNYDTSVATAETASIFMENSVLEALIKNSDDKTRLSLQMMKLNNDVSSIFRQTACYKFEQDMHKSYRELGYLSKQQISALFQQNMSAYMGNSVEQSPGSENEWVYWPHIRRWPFYVYSYTSGLLLSNVFLSMVKENPTNIAKVKSFLSAGISQSPKAIFAGLGIDITDKSFWQKGLVQFEGLLQDTEQLAIKLGKIPSINTETDGKTIFSSPI